MTKLQILEYTWYNVFKMIYINKFFKLQNTVCDLCFDEIGWVRANPFPSSTFMRYVLYYNLLNINNCYY